MAALQAHYKQPYEHPTEEARLNHANSMIEKFTRDGVDEAWFHSMKGGIANWRKENKIQQNQVRPRRPQFELLPEKTTDFATKSNM